jgi:hypothetical protein
VPVLLTPVLVATLLCPWLLPPLLLVLKPGTPSVPPSSTYEPPVELLEQ